MDFEYLLFLQNLRAEAPNFINSLLLFISEFAAGSLPVVIIVVFYWCIDKRTGQRMGLCFAGATMVTQLIKNIACVYRPWKQDARLQIAPEAAATATGYSFPSGHATLAASFYGNIAAYLKKYSKWWILPCVLLTLLTAFARNWLGAHTPEWLWLSTGIRAVDHCVEGICAREAHPCMESRMRRGADVVDQRLRTHRAGFRQPRGSRSTSARDLFT